MSRTTLTLAALAAGLVVTTGEAAMVERTVDYADGETTLKGYLAYDDALDGPRPGVVVIHEWYGLNDYAKRRANQLAELGYVAFAADMYGDGRVGANREEAQRLAGSVRGTPAMRRRAVLAFDTLKAQPNVDPARIAAIGYCFGGTGVLELAYSGAPVAGVVSFHGGLALPGEADSIQAKILILAGADDRASAPEAVGAWQAAMNEKGADWQFVAYSGAVHAFTNPAAGNNPAAGAAYHEAADKRSWEHMRVFFAELFGE